MSGSIGEEQAATALSPPWPTLPAPALETFSWSEPERMQALRDYDILDTAPEAAFDDVVRLASQLCRAPMAAISLVDQARQWFKAEQGVGRRETPRDISFCAHAIRQGGVMVVPDALQHPAFSSNPLVMGEPGIRFYAGAVLTTPAGMPLGSLCVMDSAPRAEGLTQDQVVMLQALGRQVVTQLELRRVLAAERRSAASLGSLAAESERGQAELRQSKDRLRLAMSAAMVGAWDWDAASERFYGDSQVARTLGLDPAAMAAGIALSDYLDVIHPDDRAWVMQSVTRAVTQGAEFADEYRINGPLGVRWILSRGRGYLDDAGQPLSCNGIGIDITDRRETEEALREANAGRELAMQAARLGRWDHHPSKGLYYWDPRCRDMLGLQDAPADGVFESLSLVLHPDDRGRVAAGLERAMHPDRIGAYAEEYRVVLPETGEARWMSALGRSMFEDGRCTRFVGVLEDVTERKMTEAHQALLANELNHRVKNTLAVVQAMVSQSLQTSASPQSARRAITDRLVALGRAHDILTRTSWSAAPINEIVATAAQGLGVDADRIRATGPARRLAPKPALSLAIALHELGTNAVKYGALSNAHGHVDVSWSIASDAETPSFHLQWREAGGPGVVAEQRQGFGSRLIQSALALEFRGQSTLRFDPLGVVWTLKAPLSAMEDDEARVV